jgi:TRAP-type C4-dicarboxylate transport system permease small subunit
MKSAKKMLDYVTKFEYAVMVVAFVIMVAAYFISVVNRNFIKASMPWTEELALYSMTFMALLGTEVGLRDGTQVSVTAVIDKLHGTVKKIVSLVEQLVLVVFSFVMTKAGVALVTKQMQTGQTTPVLKIPMAFMYASLVLAFGIILIVQVGILIEKVMALKKKEAEE